MKFISNPFENVQGINEMNTFGVFGEVVMMGPHDGGHSPTMRGGGSGMRALSQILSDESSSYSLKHISTGEHSLHISWGHSGYWKNCVKCILTRYTPQLDREEVKMDLMLVNMKSDLFPLISTIILPKVLTLCYPLHFETLTVIYWNSCVTLTLSKDQYTYFRYTKSWLQCRPTNM